MSQIKIYAVNDIYNRVILNQGLAKITISLQFETMCKSVTVCQCSFVQVEYLKPKDDRVFVNVL